MATAHARDTAYPDPYRFPSSTSLRFGVLVLSALVLCVDAISRRIGDALTSTTGREAYARHDCYASVYQQGNASPEAFAACGPEPVPMPLWALPAALAVFAILVAAVYLFLPAVRIRRRGYVAIDAVLPDLVTELEDLRRSHGVTTPVRWLAAPLDATVAASAFGRAGRRYIVLSGGSIAARTSDHDMFRLVVLHELAHIRNRDVDIAYLAIAIWRVTIPIALLEIPSAVVVPILLSDNAAQLITGTVGALQVVLLMIIVPLLRAGLFRTRELYADARVRTWTTPWAVELSLAQQAKRPEPWGRRALRPHPSSLLRQQTLYDDRALFRLTFAETLAAGLVIGILHEQVGGLARARPEAEMTLWATLGAVIAGSLIALLWTIVALRARQRFTGGETRRAMTTAAVGTGLGWSLGVGPLAPQTWMDLYNGGFFGAVALVCWMLLCPPLAMLGGRWVLSTTRPWIPTSSPTPGTLWRAGALIVALSIVLACVVLWCELVPTAIAGFGLAFADGVPFPLLELPAFWAALIFSATFYWPATVLGLVTCLALFMAGRWRSPRPAPQYEPTP